MKKLVILTLALMMVIAFASVSMASTLGVNVSKGNTVCIEKGEIYSDATSVTGNFGVSDKLLLSAGYTTNADFFTLGARYEIMDNFAAAFRYATEPDGADTDAWSIDVRGKLPIDKKIALAGKVGYTDAGSSIFNLYAAAEYTVNDNFIPTLAVDYYDTDEDGVDSPTYLVLGMDVYPTKTLSIYLDYNIDTDSSAGNCVYLGLEFAL